jgi:hypothetical protein
MANSTNGKFKKRKKGINFFGIVVGKTKSKYSLFRTTKYTVELTDKQESTLRESNFGEDKESTIANIVSQIVFAAKGQRLSEQQRQTTSNGYVKRFIKKYRKSKKG